MYAEIPFAKAQYPIQQKFGKEILVTKNDNRLGEKAAVLGMHNILVAGRTTIDKVTTIRGDLGRISIGKNCVIVEGAVLSPSDQFENNDKEDQSDKAKIGIKFLPMTVGDFVVIGKNSVVRAAVVGSYVYIGDSCIIQAGCVLDSCCMLLPNTILAKGTVVPPYMVYGGSPGQCVGQLPPSFQFEMEQMCREFHSSMSPKELIRAGRKTAGKKSSGAPKSGERKNTGPTAPAGTRPQGIRAETRFPNQNGGRTQPRTRT